MVSPAKYADVEIRILECQEQGYPVEITVNSEQEFTRGYLDASFLPWQSGDDPQQDGERLFQWLCANEPIRSAWLQVRSAWPQSRIRLRIDATAPELHTIPWELLRSLQDGQIAQNLAATVATPFSRYLAGTWQPGSPILKRPVKILVAIPHLNNMAEYGLQPFNVEQEWITIQQAVAELIIDKTVELIQMPLSSPCTLAALEAALRKGVHILHFIGHGVFDRNLGPVVVMANAANDVELVHAQAFAEMLSRLLSVDQQNDQKLRLVYLDSCETATRDTADAFRGFAPMLVQAGLPAVIAMQEQIAVVTSQTFSQTFYRQLLQHGQVDLACNEARSTVLSAKLPGAAIPVLFMRLRDGQLLNHPRQVSSEQKGRFWPILLENINRGQCTPFLGSQVLAGLLPDRATLAQKLAIKYEYPLPDPTNLVHVAQYIAMSDPALLRDEYRRLLKNGLFDYLGVKRTDEEKRRFRTLSLSESASELKWAEQVLTLQENEVHHVLAALELPLYMTTNIDNFMVETLRGRGLTPRRVGPRWIQPQAGTPQWVLTPDPSAKDPVVFHLNGFDGDPEQQENLVLSEDDYMTHLVRLVRDQEQLLPSNVLQMLSEHSFLFLGYQLDDWEFRTILQSIIKPLTKTNRAQKMHIGVQLDPEHTPSEEKVRDYLASYLGQYKIAIYWGTPQDFVRELYNRWQVYLETSDDD